MCTKKHNSAEGWKYSKRKQHIYKTNKKQQKNDRTSQCQQILQQRSTVDYIFFMQRGLDKMGHGSSIFIRIKLLLFVEACRK
jgi:hypothetical protein